MADFNPVQNSFIAGEVSPRLEAREDLPQFSQSLRIAENGTVLPHGGYIRRSGSRFVAAVKNPADTTVLIPFKFSIEQAYVIEVGNQYVRFFSNQSPVEVSPGVLEEQVTPWQLGVLKDLRWAQSNDVLIVTNRNNAPQNITRTSAITFTVAKTIFRVPPLRAFNLNTGLTAAIASSGTALTVTGFAFGVSDVGRHIMIEHGTAPNRVHDYYEITAQAGATATVAKFASVTKDGEQAVASAADTIAATSNFALGMFSDAEGATDVEFHEGRLFLGGTATEPDRFVGSVSDDFFNFSIESPENDDAANSDRAISRRVVGNEQATIQWMVSSDEQLFIGGTGQEFTVRGLDNGILTPATTVVKPLTNRGSAAVSPVVVDSQVIFASGQKLRELIFDERNNGFRARDITILAEHILNEGIEQVVYQQDPDSIIWVLRKDGFFVGFTFEREQEVIGAHRHFLGGSTTGTVNGVTGFFGRGIVERMAVIPEPLALIEDQVWCVVRRTINGLEQRYIEFIDKQYRPAVSASSTREELIAAVGEGRFVDSYLTNTVAFSPATATVSGLDHLEGETVSVLADGAVHPDVVVSGGSITLTRAVEFAVVGLQYRTRGMTQRFLTGGTVKGTGVGRKHRIKRMSFMVYNTLGLRYGPNAQALDTLEFRGATDPMDESPPLLHTGFFDVAMPSPGNGWTFDPVVYFEQNQPLPFTMLAVAPYAETNERD